MKLKAHYYRDWLGGWDFDNDIDYYNEVDIPVEVFDEYEKAMANYIKACDAVRDAVKKESQKSD